MQEKRFMSADGQEKVAYEFTRPEFTLLVDSLRYYGHAGKTSIVRTNDPKVRARPRAVTRTEAIEKIHELISDGVPASQERSDMEALRSDRAEVMHALKDPNSGLARPHGIVTLGLYTTAVVFNELQQPVADNASNLGNIEQLQDMMNQFNADREQRLKEAVQVSGF